MTYFIGLNSGTSMDGIDCALVDVETHRILQGVTFPYPQHIIEKLEVVLNTPLQPIQVYRQLDRMIGEAFSDAANTFIQLFKLNPKDIIAIGSHGQTLMHDPMPPNACTLQLGCPHTIAEKTGITTVADFRTRDMVLGGQGAPLAPLYHAALFQHEKKPLAIVNIGGIANLTVLDEDGGFIGFDVGPGNCLMDAWIFEHLGEKFDKNGDWARTGKPIESLLNAFMRDPFFEKLPPKSIGREYFSMDWIRSYLSSEVSLVDIQATLSALTVSAIVNAFNAHAHGARSLFLCGGGVHNVLLFEQLQAALFGVSIRSTETRGIHPDFLEAALFAWLASQTLQGKLLPCMSITGAKRPAMLGVIYPSNAFRGTLET